ncbi:MAG: fasciclin domain-containing protein [Bacteroidetes bacterium]|jgi:uncharacterized surface protein with fasciclin (FAS1) repeats|nr:fasciclin domain-containing protein [Bacteroidota bacterium]
MLFLSACGSAEGDQEKAKSEDEAPQNIVKIAQNSENYTLLADAVATAGLADALSGDGPFTVFAPDNGAFEALLASNENWNSLQNIPKATLTAVLTNHVISGQKVGSGDLSNGFVTTMNKTSFGDANTQLYANVDDGVTINGTVTVTAPDIEASNGVIHGVDAVIGVPNIVTFATAHPDLSSLVAALTREDLSADFVSTLSGNGPFTVFAPTNTAFQQLLDSNEEWNALADIPVETLETVLSYHVSAAGNVRSTDLSQDMEVPTVAEAILSVDLSGDAPKIVGGSQSANVVAADIQSSNGVIHVIDQVLLP